MIHITKETLYELLENFERLYPEATAAFRVAVADLPEGLVRCEKCANRRDDEDYACGHYCVKRPSNGGYFCEDGDFCSYGEPKEGTE